MKFLLLIAMGVMVTLAEESQLLNEFAVGNNGFAGAVYKELLKTNSGNFLVCPLSAETILALVHAGAGGRTAKQLSTALRLPESKENIAQIFRDFTPLLQGNEHYTLSSANKVYVQNGYKVKDQFKSTAVDVFNAEIQNIDFENAEQAASEMNRWVEGKTHNKIKKAVNPIDLNKNTRAVLINAMYFLGTWAIPFQMEDTTKQPFFLNNKDQVQVDMMHQNYSYNNYYESSELNAKFLELPYKGEGITMTIVLPNDKEGLSALESRINDVFVLPNYRRERIHVEIPKFKIETSIQFIPVLEALGVVDAFGVEADLRDMVADTSLIISKIIQKTFIEVDEKGPEAAAETVVHILRVASLVPPKEFIADHPFIFYIKIKDAVFFAGRYTSATN